MILLDAVQRHGLSGVGFVLTKGCGLIGGDLDGCRNASTGVIEPWAQAIIDLRETYYEISPSGEGVRFWTTTDLPLRKVEKGCGVELYFSGRYLTFTGDHIPGTPLEIGRASRAVDAAMQRVAEHKAVSKMAGAVGQSHSLPNDPDEAFKRKVYAESPMGRINSAALGALDKWVPELLPAASRTTDGGWRVKSSDLGRALEEDLSLHPTGIKDFGVHDLGDAREGGRTPIDVVMEWSDKPLDNVEAAEWLGVRVGVPFDSSSGSSPGPSPSDPDTGAPFMTFNPTMPSHVRRPWMSAGGFAVSALANTRKSSGTTRYRTVEASLIPKLAPP